MGVQAEATITSQGRVTVPKRIREALGFEEGARVEFVVVDEETVRVRLKKHPMERVRELQRELSRESGRGVAGDGERTADCD